MQQLLSGGFDCINISISAKTEVGDYLTSTFIEKTNEFLEDNHLNTYVDDDNETVTWKIEKTDNLYAIQKNIVKTLRNLDAVQKDEAVYSIKKYLLSKLEEFENASNDSNSKLVEKINQYFIFN